MAPKSAPKKSSAAADKAKAAQKAIKAGVVKVVRKIHTRASFRRPQTLELPRKPKYLRSSVSSSKHMDQYRVLKHPVTTESAMKLIEDHNTLVFITDLKANKRQVARAVKSMYDVEVSKVNTLVTTSGDKKAFVKLTPDHEALEVANKIGII